MVNKEPFVMRLRPVAPIATLLQILNGCSSGGSDGDPEALDDGSEIGSENPSEVEDPTAPAVPGSELTGTWSLRSYTLDDGTTGTVPAVASAEIEFRGDGILRVTTDACDGFEVPYTVSNSILTTAESIAPEQEATCGATDDDAGVLDRGALLTRALLDTQTMVAVSDDVLTVATGSNEVLVFERLAEAATVTEALAGFEWRLDAASTGDGTMRPLYGDPGRARFEGDGGQFRLVLPCRGWTGTWSVPDSVLTIDAEPIIGATCSSVAAVSAPVLRVVDTAVTGVPLTVELDDDSLVLTLPTNERLFLSGRRTSANETRPVVRLLEAGDVASQGVNSDESTTGRRGLVLYRDQASLDAVYPTLYADPVRPRGPVPTVNFDDTIVVGAFVDVYGYVGHDVTVEHAVETPDGLEIGIRYRELLGGDPVTCTVGAAFSGPYVLVAIESIAQPLSFVERTVATCSGVEAAQFDEIP